MKHGIRDQYIKCMYGKTLRVWVHGCDPGKVSDGSRLALYQTLSIESHLLSFSGMCFVLLFPSFLSFLFLFRVVYVFSFLILLSLELSL